MHQYSTVEAPRPLDGLVMAIIRGKSEFSQSGGATFQDVLEGILGEYGESSLPVKGRWPKGNQGAPSVEQLADMVQLLCRKGLLIYDQKAKGEPMIYRERDLDANAVSLGITDILEQLTSSR